MLHFPCHRHRVAAAPLKSLGGEITLWCHCCRLVVTMPVTTSPARHVLLAQQQGVLQAENPKQQYLLLRALNEVITSLTANTPLPERQQDEVSFTCLFIGMSAFTLASSSSSSSSYARSFSMTACATDCISPFGGHSWPVRGEKWLNVSDMHADTSLYHQSLLHYEAGKNMVLNCICPNASKAKVYWIKLWLCLL